MNEYIFFDAGLRDRVMEYAKGQGVVCELPDDIWARQSQYRKICPMFRWIQETAVG